MPSDPDFEVEWQGGDKAVLYAVDEEVLVATASFFSLMTRFLSAARTGAESQGHQMVGMKWWAEFSRIVRNLESRHGVQEEDD